MAGIREACRIGREVLDAAHAACKPGVTTDEIDRIVSERACGLSCCVGLRLMSSLAGWLAGLVS